MSTRTEKVEKQVKKLKFDTGYTYFENEYMSMVYDVDLYIYKVSVEHKINQEFVYKNHFEFKFKINDFNFYNPYYLFERRNFEMYLFNMTDKNDRLNNWLKSITLEECNFLDDTMVGNCQNISRKIPTFEYDC